MDSGSLAVAVWSDYSAGAMKESTQQRLRFVGRYVIAAATIPVGVAMGLGGLAQNWSRRIRARPRRTAPEAVGTPADSGLRRVGES